MAEKIKLDWSKWNDFVGDTTQCTYLSHEEEIKFLSSKDPTLAQYLKLHPEMSRELMVPSGFPQRPLRRYERYLGSDQPLCAQNGDLDGANRKAKVFDAMLPDSPKVMLNPNNAQQPSWRVLNAFICGNGECQLDGEAMAPEYLYKDIGKKVRIINYREGMKVEVTLDEWLLMWDHVVCGFAGPLGRDGFEDVEFGTLHKARTELLGRDAKHKDWYFHGRQQLAIIQKQLEHRLRAAHKNRPNLCFECCPWRASNDPNDVKYKKFLTKEEAAEIVVDERIKKGETLKCCSYDEIVYEVLKKRGIQVPPDVLHWSTAQELDHDVANHGSGMSVAEYLQLISQMDPNDPRLHKCPAEGECGCGSDEE